MEPEFCSQTSEDNILPFRLVYTSDTLKCASITYTSDVFEMYISVAPSSGREMYQLLLIVTLLGADNGKNFHNLTCTEQSFTKVNTNQRRRIAKIERIHASTNSARTVS